MIALQTPKNNFASFSKTRKQEKPKKTNINIIQQYKLTNVTENSNKKIISNR